MPSNVIETLNLTKYYGQVCGIEELNLEIEKGELFGFLGPNGAGKSTTIRLLLNLLIPTLGEVRIFGKDLRNNYKSIFSNIGYVPGELKLYEELTGAYFLAYMNSFHLKPASLKQELVSDFQLTDADLHKKIKHFSRGMKQKLGIIQALQIEPDLLIMDEPSEGLDPLNKNVLYSYLEKLKNRGKTIFFSSHNLSEVEKICDRIGLVKDGKLIAHETLESLKRKMIRQMQVEFHNKIDTQVFNFPGIKDLQKNENTFTLTISGDLNPILKILAENPVKRMIFPEPSLEDMFMTYYQKSDK